MGVVPRVPCASCFKKSPVLRFGSLHNFNLSCSRERDRSPAEAIADCETDDCLLIQPTNRRLFSSFFLPAPLLPSSNSSKRLSFLWLFSIRGRSETEDRQRPRERWRRRGGRCHTTSCKPYSGFEGGHLISFVILSTSP